MTDTLERHPAIEGQVGSAEGRPDRTRATHRRVARTVATVLITALMTGLLLVAAAVTVVPRVIGAVPLTVLTGSMEPTISPGDLVVVRHVDPEALRVGDVVTVQPESANRTLVTHRVIDVVRGPDGVRSVVTQGDANNAADAPIVPDQVMGRVLYTVPWVGNVTHRSWGPSVATAVGVGLVLYCVVMVAVPDRGRGAATEQDDVPPA